MNPALLSALPKPIVLPHPYLFIFAASYLPFSALIILFGLPLVYGVGIPSPKCQLPRPLLHCFPTTLHSVHPSIPSLSLQGAPGDAGMSIIGPRGPPVSCCCSFGGGDMEVGRVNEKSFWEDEGEP